MNKLIKIIMFSLNMSTMSARRPIDNNLSRQYRAN